MFHTYRDDGHSTWDQCWNVACKIQLAAEVSWCCQPESYCKVPLWKRRWKKVGKGWLCGPKSVDLSLAAAWQESTDTHTAFHLTVKCHHHNPTPDPLSPPAWGYLRYIKCHPLLQLLSDVLQFPFCQIGNKNSWIERAGVGFHGKLSDGFFFVIQKPNIIILGKKKKRVEISLKYGQITI